MDSAATSALISGATGVTGTLVGVIGSQMLQQRSENQRRAHAQTDAWRRLAIDAYVEAREGLLLMQPDILEDSVDLDVDHRAPFEPQVAEGNERIREARQDFLRAAAEAEGSVAPLLDELANELLAYEHAYARARNWCRHVYEERAKFGQPREATEKIFDRYWKEVHGHRRKLVGQEAFDQPGQGVGGKIGELRSLLGPSP